VAVGLFGMPDGTYFQSMAEGAQWRDVEMGLIKSVVFGLLIGWIATAKGYYLHLDRSGAFGAEGVSRVTTNAVVLSAIAVLFADYLVGAIML
jgi:phospholipid/cholesterol/gamma-HCH transport system permease protein